MLYQLRQLSTNKNLSDPQPLPENWGPIHGLENFKDKLSDLSWLGDPELIDMGWFETDIPEIVAEPVQPEQTEDVEAVAQSTARRLLSESDWAMLPDVPMTEAKKSEWAEYRRALREIKIQPGYPKGTVWPVKPT